MQKLFSPAMASITTAIAILTTLSALSIIQAYAYNGKDHNAHNSKMHGSHKGYIEKKFSKIDTNNNQLISKAEFKAFQEKKFSDIDSNQDGKITKSEMRIFKKEKHKKYKNR